MCKNEENTEACETRYPFHGFYLPLVAEMEEIEAERAREQELQSQSQELATTTTLLGAVSPTESPSDERASKTTLCTLSPADMELMDAVPHAAEPPDPKAWSDYGNSYNKRLEWVADLIGDGFKTWGPGLVAIEASTGTGKTSFVLGPLMDWCVAETEKVYSEKSFKYITRMLILCNRSSLKDSIMKQYMKEREKYIYFDPEWKEETSTLDDFKLVHIMTYQRFENIANEHMDRIKKKLADYKVIVLDEVHHFVDDAPFADNTDILYDAILKAAEKSTVVAMTATPGSLFSTWKDEKLLEPSKYYFLPKKMEHITAAYVYSRDHEMIDILQKLPADEKALVQVNTRKDLEGMKERFGDKAGYYCSDNNYDGAMDKLEDCIKDEKLQKQIVFSTIVLYNGVNIRDRSLKHIVVESVDPSVMIQMQGRKRPIDKDDTCTVYYRVPQERQGKKFRSHERYQLEAEINVAERWYDREKGKPEMWDNLCHGDGAYNRLKQCKVLVDDFANGTYRINHRRLAYYRRQIWLIDEIRERGYWQTAKRYAWDLTLEVKPMAYKNAAVVQFINEHIGQLMQKEELRNGLIGAGLYAPTSTSEGAKKLNQRLKKYKVEIVSVRSKKNTGSTPWMIQRIA